VKVADIPRRLITLSTNLTRASCLRENLTSSSYGEGLETDQASAEEPRQSLTRQLFFKWIKQHLNIKRFLGRTENAVRIQILTALIAYLLVVLHAKAHAIKTSLWMLLNELRATLFQRPQIEMHRHRRWRQQLSMHTLKQWPLFT
jgi:putative transposase